MITIVLTNRNRDLRIVKNCLDSLKNQTEKGFEVILVDYGSTATFSEALSKLIKNDNFIELISCPTEGQLWNKSRAINIALKQTISPYFLVGDIDLIFHPHFIKIATQLAVTNKLTYFQYGFLAKEESLLDKKFEDFSISFLGNQEVTGTTLFHTNDLKSVHGYDEFYHGWGAEDTDIHIRLINKGLKVDFYDSEILIKHQWHPKAYRSKSSLHPFHSNLEKINHGYMVQTEKTKRTVVNKQQEWGKLPNINDYGLLNQKPDYVLHIDSSLFQVQALLAQLNNFENETLQITVTETNTNTKRKHFIKRLLGKKHSHFLKMEHINNLLLEELIKNYRNCPYHYSFDRQKNSITLTINFTK